MFWEIQEGNIMERQCKNDNCIASIAFDLNDFCYISQDFLLIFDQQILASI